MRRMMADTLDADNGDGSSDLRIESDNVGGSVQHAHKIYLCYKVLLRVPCTIGIMWALVTRSAQYSTMVEVRRRVG